MVFKQTSNSYCVRKRDYGYMWFLLLIGPITGNNEVQTSMHANIKRGLKMFIRASDGIKTNLTIYEIEYFSHVIDI